MKNKSEIEIKLLVDCLQHIPNLAELWYEQISRHWAPNASIEKAKQNLLKHANYDKLPMTFVALENDQPVGMASLRENDGIQPERAPWLGSLVVDPTYRNQKIGEQLIDAVKRHAVLLGYPKLYLLAFDQTIPSWYTKLGWKSIGIDELFGHPVVVMDIKLHEEGSCVVLNNLDELI